MCTFDGSVLSSQSISNLSTFACLSWIVAKTWASALYYLYFLPSICSSDFDHWPHVLSSDAEIKRTYVFIAVNTVSVSFEFFQVSGIVFWSNGIIFHRYAKKFVVNAAITFFFYWLSRSTPSAGYLSTFPTQSSHMSISIKYPQVINHEDPCQTKSLLFVERVSRLSKYLPLRFLICMISAISNPFLYGLFNETFKDGLQKIVSRVRPRVDRTTHVTDLEPTDCPSIQLKQKRPTLTWLNFLGPTSLDN